MTSLPSPGSLWGNPADKSTWRFVYRRPAAGDGVYFASAGYTAMFLVDIKDWRQWVAETNAVDLTPQVQPVSVPPEPPADTVRVRAAVLIASDGTYGVYGGSVQDNEEPYRYASDTMYSRVGVQLDYIEATIVRRKPATVEAEVKP